GSETLRHEARDTADRVPAARERPRSTADDARVRPAATRDWAPGLDAAQSHPHPRSGLPDAAARCGAGGAPGCARRETATLSDDGGSGRAAGDGTARETRPARRPRPRRAAIRTTRHTAGAPARRHRTAASPPARPAQPPPGALRARSAGTGRRGNPE